MLLCVLQLLYDLNCHDNSKEYDRSKFSGNFKCITITIALKHSEYYFKFNIYWCIYFKLLFAFTIIFMERRSANSIWAWLLVLVFSPLFGFILYLTIRTTILT